MNCRWVSKENRNVKCTRKADSSGSESNREYRRRTGARGCDTYF